MALPGHFGAKKGLLSRFRQVVAPLRRVVQPLRCALAALRRVVRALRRALAALRRVVRALRCALAALRRVVQPLRRALAALRRVVQPLRRVVAALRPALFYEFDAFPCLHDHVLLFTKPGDTESDPKSGVSRAGAFVSMRQRVEQDVDPQRQHPPHWVWVRARCIDCIEADVQNVPTAETAR